MTSVINTKQKIIITMKLKIFALALLGLGAQALMTLPKTIGAGHARGCDLELKHVDYNEDATNSQILVCGLTMQADMVHSQTDQRCLDTAVPFATMYSNDAITAQKTFAQQVTYPAESKTGLLSDIKACKMHERHTWAGSRSWKFNLVVLKFSSLTLPAQTKLTQLLLIFEGSAMNLLRSINIGYGLGNFPIMINQLATASNSNLESQLVTFIHALNTRLDFSVLHLASGVNEAIKSQVSSTHEFKAVSMQQINDDLWIGGAYFEIATGNFYPLFVKFTQSTLVKEASVIFTPATETGDDFYYVEMMRQSVFQRCIQGVSLSKSASNFQSQKLRLSSPILLWSIRTPNSNPVLAAGCPEIDVMAAKFSQMSNPNAMFAQLFNFVTEGPYQTHLYIALSTTQGGLGYVGDANHYILILQTMGQYYCSASGFYVRKTKGTDTRTAYITTTAAAVSFPSTLWNYQFHALGCMQATTTYSLCKLVAVIPKSKSTWDKFYLFNTVYRNDSSSLVPENQGGKYSFFETAYSVDIGVADTLTLDTYYYLTNTTQSIVSSMSSTAFFNCDAVSQSLVQSIDYFSSEYYGSAALVTGATDSFNFVEAPVPTVHQCDGTTAECNQCFFLMDVQLSESNNAVSLASGWLGMSNLDLATGMMQIHFDASSYTSKHAYFITEIFGATVNQKLEHSFVIHLNVGYELAYSSCSPWCLYDPTSTVPASLTHTKPARRYRQESSGDCWLAYSDCDTCLDGVLVSSANTNGHKLNCLSQCSGSEALTYTPPANLLSFTTDVAINFQIQSSLLISTLSSSQVSAMGVFSLIGGQYAEPSHSIFTFTQDNLEVSSLGYSSTFTDLIFYARFQYNCATYASQIVEWTPSGDYLGTNVLAYVPFKLTIQDCQAFLTFTPTAAALNQAISGLHFPAASSAQDYHRLVFHSDQASLALPLSDVFTWPVNASGCHINMLWLCSDSSCSTLLTTGPVVMNSNPVVASVGTMNPVVEITRSAGFSTEVFLKSQSSVSGVIKTTKMLFGVCGEETLAANTISPIYIATSGSSEWVPIGALTSFFAYSYPSADASTACEISEYLYCLDSGCSDAMSSNQVQLNGGNLEVLRSSISTSFTLYIRGKTHGQVEATASVNVCLLDDSAVVVEQVFPGAEWYNTLTNLFNSTSLCPISAADLRLADNSALSFELQYLFKEENGELKINPPPLIQGEYTVPLILIFSSLSGTVIKPITYTLKATCTSQLSVIPGDPVSTLLPFEDGGSMAIANAYTFFQNGQSNSCPISSCRLLAPGCSLSYTGRLSMAGTLPHVIRADIGVKEGYTEQACVECTDGWTTVQFDQFEVTQNLDCSQTLSLANILPGNSTLEFDASITDEEIEAATTFFQNSKPDACPITFCQLDADCGPFQSSHVSIEQALPFTIMAPRNVEEGYTQTLCIYCSNDFQGIEYKGFSVTLEPIKTDKSTEDTTELEFLKQTLGEEVEMTENEAPEQESTDFHFNRTFSDLEPLEAFISKINSFGEVTIEFSQLFKNQDFQEIDSNVLEIALIPYPENPFADLLDFNWTCLKFGETELVIDLRFEQPLQVSRGGSDFQKSKSWMVPSLKASHSLRLCLTATPWANG